MKYVYILQSQSNPDRHYTGIAEDVEARLALHNAGKVPSSSPYRPWQIVTYIAFANENKAIAFEKYLKSGSGRAFAKRHL